MSRAPPRAKAERRPMRIVHEIDGPMQVGGGANPYATPPGGPLPTGMQVDLFAGSAPTPTEPWITEESLHIEGDAHHVLAMLRAMIRAVEACAEVHVEAGRLSPDWNRDNNHGRDGT